VQLKKIKDRIFEIASRPNNVTLSEITRIIDQLKSHGYTVSSRTAGDHAIIFRVEDQVFSICTHRGGSKQLKAHYVKAFLSAVIELELYED
jgi:hypothetical protein